MPDPVVIVLTHKELHGQLRDEIARNPFLTGTSVMTRIADGAEVRVLAGEHEVWVR